RRVRVDRGALVGDRDMVAEAAIVEAHRLPLGDDVRERAGRAQRAADRGFETELHDVSSQSPLGALLAPAPCGRYGRTFGGALSRSGAASSGGPIGSTDMKFGAAMFFTDYSMTAAELGQALEARGFESVWAPEHSHIPLSRESPFPSGGD